VSTEVTVPIVQRPWRGYDEPGLPVGMWVAQGTIIGDGSAGFTQVSFNFHTALQALSGRFFNLEQLEVHRNDDAAALGALTLVNFDLAPIGVPNRVIQMSLSPTDSQTDAAALDNVAVDLPLFLGRTIAAGLATQLIISGINVNAVSLNAMGQGYIWEPRSTLAPGGLRRPVDSLYGR